MSTDTFAYSLEKLQEITQNILQYAKRKGLSAAAVEVSESHGLQVNVRKQQIDTIEKNHDKAAAVTVYVGKQKGYASSSDFALSSLYEMVDAAHHIARFTHADDCAGLPDAEQLANHFPELNLYHPWTLNVEQATKIACDAEQAAFAVSPLITNSEGASVQTMHNHFVMANSEGFVGGYPSSRHTISVVPIATNRDQMQRDYWYSSARNYTQLANPQNIGQYAAQRSLARLNARRLSTQQCPVLFEAPIALGLLGAFVQAVSGGALYRKTSFLLNSLGKPIFPEHIEIIEDPHIPGSMGAAPFDAEGVKTHRRHVVSNGVVQGYFLSTYSARKLGMQTTGNAGGSHQLQLCSRDTLHQDDFVGMLRRLNTGLLVTELMGQGVNYVTGDYSRGASGFWVENGEIQYPVEEITIAGNLLDMFSQIVAIGNDVITRGSKETGSILIERMTIAGH